jgi:multidrug efflux system membrane fusion protein
MKTPSIDTPRIGTLGLMALSVCIVLCASCAKSESAKKAAPPPPVATTVALEREMPLIFETYGVIEPYSTLNVKSKLTGKIMKLGFAPGQHIAKGELLVQIDQRPYEVELRIYNAQLKKNEILLSDARRILQLKEKLEASGSVTATEMFTQRATVESAAAALEADKAEIETTKLNIEYCRIVAPFDGVAGDILIHADSIVKANDDTIATFAQVKPVYASFALPERLLSALREARKAGHELKVLARPTGAGAKAVAGKLDFIDNAVNAASGTIKAKALYANSGEELWPGQYVDIEMELDKGGLYVVVPTDAIMSGQNGQQVFVVKADSSVELRHVKPLRSHGRLSAVEGLKAGERVVLTGQFRLAPGIKVEVVDSKKPDDAVKPEK